MKKGVLFLFLATLFLGCSDSDVETISDEEQLMIDIELIDAWLVENQITDTLHHPTGIRYTINKKGTGIKPLPGDLVTTKYEGRYLESGEVFDSSSNFGPIVLNTSSIILGWYFMLLEMQEGDSFTIYLPSFYAYGPRGNGVIPPNAVLVFDIELLKVE